jgi:hypothetical protein
MKILNITIRLGVDDTEDPADVYEAVTYGLDAYVAWPEGEGGRAIFEVHIAEEKK